MSESFIISSREIKVLQILYEWGGREGKENWGRERKKKGENGGRSLRDNDNAHLSGLETNKYTNGGQESSSKGVELYFLSSFLLNVCSWALLPLELAFRLRVECFSWVFSCSYYTIDLYQSLALVRVNCFISTYFHPSIINSKGHEKHTQATPSIKKKKEREKTSSFSPASWAGPRTVPWRLALKEWGREQTYCHTLGPLACSVSCQGRRERNGGLFSPRKRVSRF